MNSEKMPPETSTTDTLRSVMSRVSLATNPEQAAIGVLDGCVALSAADGGQIQLLNLAIGGFIPFIARGEIPDIALDRKSEFQSYTRRLALSPAPVKRKAYNERIGDHSRISIPVVRGRTCIAIVDLFCRDPSPANESMFVLNSLTRLIVPIYEQAFIIKLLSNMQHPIDFQQPMDVFLDEVMLLTSEASSMEYILIYRLEDEGRLSCISCWGFGEGQDPSKYDVDQVRNHPIFGNVIEEAASVSEEGGGRPVSRSALSPLPGEVVSFVATPIKVGAGIYGAILFGSRCQYEYSIMELRGFESIANAVGVSVANYQHFHDTAQSISHLGEIGVAITAIEVAQASRHEAMGTLDAAQSVIALIRSSPGKKVADVDEKLTDLSGHLMMVDNALQKIKVASRPPRRELSRVPLRAIWEEARAQVLGRLADLNIRANYVGIEPVVEVYADWFRQVFLNLLLNSIDAFAGARKGDRKIVLTVSAPSERGRWIAIRYTDNASGIDPTKLRLPPELLGLPMQQAIFEPNVTSKDDGSGYGMYLVREILSDHKGSINLVSHRGGVVFDIVIPQVQHRGEGSGTD